MLISLTIQELFHNYYMNVMNKKSSPLKTTDTSSTQGKIVKEITQMYFQKNQSYIWKRLRHQWVDKVIRYCHSTKINSKDQIEDFIYKYLKELMGWIEKGNSSTLLQKKLIEKNEEVMVLKNRIKQLIKVQKQKEDKIMRRNLKIKKLQQAIEDFYQKLSADQTAFIEEKQKILSQIRNELQKQKRINKKYEQMMENMKREAKDITRRQKLKNNKLIKDLTQQLTKQIRRLQRQGENYKEISNSLIRNLEQRNRQYLIMKEQVEKIKKKYKDDVFNNKGRELELEKDILIQKRKMQEQKNVLIEKIKELQQNYSILQQEYIKKQQQYQFHKDQFTQKYLLSQTQSFYLTYSKHQNINSNSSSQTQQVQNIKFKQKVQPDNQSCSSSQSEYIYQYDIGTQCPLIQTSNSSAQTHQLKLKHQTTQARINTQDRNSQTQLIIHDVLCQLRNLSVREQIHLTNIQHLKQKIKDLNDQLEINKKSEQIMQKQLIQFKIQNEGTRNQLEEVRHRLIKYLQTSNVEGDNQYEIKLREKQQRLNQIKRENGQLKKYNQQLLQTIEYANSLLSGTVGVNQGYEQKNYIKRGSKHQNMIINCYNCTESTGSQNRQCSQKSQQQFVVVSKYEHDNQLQKQNSSEQFSSSHQQQMGFKGTQYKQSCPQLQSYAGAVARLLCEFVNNQNKQEMKMNAFLTLVQMIKPKGQSQQKLQKFIKLRRLMNGFINNENSNLQKSGQEQEDIKYKLYRFLTSN